MKLPIININVIEDFFGYFPTFHDSEIYKIDLDRKNLSACVTVYAFETSKEIDNSGKYKKIKECIIEIIAEEIIEMELKGFNQQNVLEKISFIEINNGIKLILEKCYGLSGYVSAKRIIISSLHVL